MKKKKSMDPDDRSFKAPFIYGDPVYPAQDDIYNRQSKTSFTEEGDEIGENVDLEQPTLPGEDLDIPGSELDDAEEKTGSEDEENNYYSLGGDNHDDLEEDKS